MVGQIFLSVTHKREACFAGNCITTMCSVARMRSVAILRGVAAFGKCGSFRKCGSFGTAAGVALGFKSDTSSYIRNYSSNVVCILLSHF